MKKHWYALGLGLLAMSLSTEALAEELESKPAAGGTDHSKYVGSFAGGLLGSGTILFDGGVLTAPVIGARYWMSETMGIDAGLGFIAAGASVTAGDTTTDAPQPAAFMLHGGLPLVMADSQHVVIEVIPEMNLGFAGNTVDGNPDDTVTRGFHFDIGARAGAELHFGFIDLPQLSLQAGIGLLLSYDRTSTSIGDVDSSTSNWFFGTRGGNDPWDIFSGNVSALYYFGK